MMGWECEACQQKRNAEMVTEAVRIGPLTLVFYLLHVMLRNEENPNG
jgi:hypothetical protein